MKRQQSRRRSGVVVVVALALGLLAAGVSSADPGAHAAKRRAHHLVGTASLHLVRKSGNVLYESGTSTGTYAGTVSARFVTGITKVTGTVTFHPYSGGTLSMTAVGYPQSAGTVTRFVGNIAVSGGSGRFKSALGSGSFTGTANRRTWAVTVHADATITY
jgi:hypothetical protein